MRGVKEPAGKMCVDGYFCGLESRVVRNDLVNVSSDIVGGWNGGENGRRVVR